MLKAGWGNRCVCVCVCKSYHQFNFLNIPLCCENSLSFPSPPPLSWRFDMLNLLILFFFLLWWGSVLFKGLNFPPDCLNPTSVWIVFLFQTKDRGRITISLPFTLALSSGSSLGFILKNHCPAAFCYCFIVEVYKELWLNVDPGISSEWGFFSPLQASGADLVAGANKVSSGLLSEMLTSS